MPLGLPEELGLEEPGLALEGEGTRVNPMTLCAETTLRSERPKIKDCIVANICQVKKYDQLGFGA